MAKTQLTTEERDLQSEIMERYRKDGIVPTIPVIAKDTRVSYTTINKFMSGNSWHRAIRDYIAIRLRKNLKPMPPDVENLLEIWDGISEES